MACTCPWELEDRGGGYSEIVPELDPDCSEHAPIEGVVIEHPVEQDQVILGFDPADPSGVNVFIAPAGTKVFHNAGWKDIGFTDGSIEFR